MNEASKINRKLKAKPPKKTTGERKATHYRKKNAPVAPSCAPQSSSGFSKPPAKVTYYSPSSAKPPLQLKDSIQTLVESGEAAGLEDDAHPLSVSAQAETELAERLIGDIADSSSDVNTLSEEYGLKREELGRLTGFSLRALAEWSAGKLPSEPAKRRLREVRRLLDALAEIVKRERIPRWLHQPNSAFGGLTPLQVIELGEMDRLWAMVHDLGSGQPG
jgi:DNA-binding transcriptional regulator YiaG